MPNPVDTYISHAAPFAQPILRHLQKLVLETCPDAEEMIKWSFPNYVYKGTILCSFAAFKSHCTFGFWNAAAMSDPQGILNPVGETSMGQLGKIKSLNDLPPDYILKEYILQAAELNSRGVKVQKKTKQAKEIQPSPEFMALLQKNKIALKNWGNFTPGKHREYIEWMEGAKTEITRDKRRQQAIENIREGKSLNWKYEQKS